MFVCVCVCVCVCLRVVQCLAIAHLDRQEHLAQGAAENDIVHKLMRKPPALCHNVILQSKKDSRKQRQRKS